MDTVNVVSTEHLLEKAYYIRLYVCVVAEGDMGSSFLFCNFLFKHILIKNAYILEIPLDELSEAAACRSKNRLPPPSRNPQCSMKSPIISQRVNVMLMCDTTVLASLLCLTSFAVHYFCNCYSLFFINTY